MQVIRVPLVGASKEHFYFLKVSMYIRALNKYPSRVAKLWCILKVYQIFNTHTNSRTVYIIPFRRNVKSQFEKFHKFGPSGPSSPPATPP